MYEKANKTSEKTNKLNNLNDENLYQLCKRYGEMTLRWRRKFAGLLPEVNKRRLYEKKGFLSIFEFAKKLAGMSEPQVRLAVNLEKRFEKTPVLKELLVNGKVSINKLARVASIANSENEEFLATQVQILSKSAVETLVRDEKYFADSKNGKTTENENQNGLQKSFFEDRDMPGQMLNLSSEVQQKLLELQQKGIDINNLILEFLNKRTEGIAKAKKEISSKTTVTSRHIPVQIKKIIHQEYGTKCSIPNCQKQAATFHHTQRFALSKTHDPHFIAPLCHEHHLIAHSIDMNFNRKRFATNVT